MTADPSIPPRRKPGWYVVTHQGVVLSAGFGDRTSALQARDFVVAELHRDLTWAGRLGRFIASACGRFRLSMASWWRRGMASKPCRLPARAGPGSADLTGQSHRQSHVCDASRRPYDRILVMAQTTVVLLEHDLDGGHRRGDRDVRARRRLDHRLRPPSRTHQRRAGRLRRPIDRGARTSGFAPMPMTMDLRTARS